MKNVGVAIIVPTCNSADTLRICLKSIERQSYPFYDIIIIDSYSTDSTVRIGKDYGAKIISHKGNAASARNVGIAESLCKYLLFLDSDQTVSKTLISECVKISEEHDVGIIWIPELFSGHGFWSSCSAAWKNLYFLLARRCHQNNVLGIEPRFFLKDHVTSAGSLNEKLSWGEDYELFLRLRRMNLKEAWCRSRIFHHEPRTLAKILRKNYQYGKSMAHLPRTNMDLPRQISIISQTYLTAKAIPRSFPRSFLSYVGMFILLGLRTLAIIFGLLLRRAHKLP